MYWITQALPGPPRNQIDNLECALATSALVISDSPGRFRQRCATHRAVKADIAQHASARREPIRFCRQSRSPSALARRQTLKCRQAIWNDMEGLFVDSIDRHLRCAK